MNIKSLRIGQGFDVHPFAEPGSNRVLVLGGVEFPEGPALAGHSDADVLAHALTDAILGAAGLGDIGQHFPDSDPAWSGADSLDLLAEAVRLVELEGWAILNADCTVIADRPRIAPHKPVMQENLSTIMGGSVTVKGKRTEGVAGLGGGIQCHAVALLASIDGSSPEPGQASTSGPSRAIRTPELLKPNDPKDEVPS